MTLWQNQAVSVYPESIADKARTPKFVGRCSDENGAGRSASFLCGSSIRVSIAVDAETKRIEQIRYETTGCGFTIASAEELSERVVGRKLTELSGTKSLPSRSDPTAVERSHCLEMVAEGFRAALADHRRRTIEEFRGETALICTCFGVSEDTIVSVIATQKAETVTEVSVACNAGSGCGSCQMLIQELIDSVADGR